MAFEVLQCIGNLYVVGEGEDKHLSIETRQQLHAEKSLPILVALYDWLMQTHMQTPNGGAPAKA